MGRALEMKSKAERRREGAGTEKGQLEVVALAHCILNQATRWRQVGKASRSRGPVKEALDILSSLEIGALQMPCPEFSFCGNPRPPRSKDEYENLPGFQNHCQKLAKMAAQNLKTLISLSKKPKIKILAIVGVERSPTCGVSQTPKGRGTKTEYWEEKGLFMEALEAELRAQGLEVPMLGLDLHHPETFLKDLKKVRAEGG